MLVEIECMNEMVLVCDSAVQKSIVSVCIICNASNFQRIKSL